MPHSCFSLRNLTRIPSHLRVGFYLTHRLATDALKAGDSPDSIDSLFVISEDLPAADKVHFLPVLYKLLDPPPLVAKPRDLLDDNDDTELIQFALRGWSVLKSLALLRGHSLFPRAALADIWDRVWICILLQHEYMEDLAQAGIRVEEVWRLHLSTILIFGYWENFGDPSPMARPPHLEPLVSDSHDIRRYLTIIWKRMVRDKGLRIECSNDMLHLFGYFMRSAEPQNFDQIIQGAGGTLFDFCSLAMRHLDVVILDIQSGDVDARWIVHSLSFLFETIIQNNDEFPLMLSTLLAMGLVKCLVNVSFALHAVPATGLPLGAVFIQLQLFFVMGLALRLQNPRQWVVEGLRSGLLLSMAQSSNAEMIERHPLVEPFTQVLEILPGYLTLYSVLSRLQNALEQVDSSGLTEHILQSQIRDAWLRFRLLADKRIALKLEFDEKYHSMRMCDNIKCNILKDKTDFRRCSECQSMYYCPGVCQKADWTSGHRTVCARLAKKSGEHLSTKDKAFLRFLLHTDYTKHRRQILSLRGAFMMSSSNPFYTEFDYTAGAVRIQVLGAKPLIPRLPAGSVRLEGAYRLRRLVLDRRRMGLDVAVLPDGPDARYWILPMRSSSPKNYEALVVLARRKVAERISDVEYEESLTLLADEVDGVELH
ncbi:hypothetical protein FB451DRAFT_1564938 [Mycena latifolia]|nr:hypothetical protein FB451DRAFT_1564938 [Mycena latifolia]